MELLQRLKGRIPEETDELILDDCLFSAENIIRSKRYPFGDGTEKIEPKYLDLQLRIAVEIYNKRGVEGQTAHSENGVSRTYETAGISENLLSEITPVAKAVY